MANLRSGFVFVQNVFAGIISETTEGYQFVYDEDYIHSDKSPAVSVTMPVREEPYISTTLFPFFDGLIPEGWLLDLSARNWKLDINDRFGLLLVCCEDCIGDVAVRGGD